MERALPWSGAVLAGVVWLFLARLISDELARFALTPVFWAAPLVVFSFALPRRVALVVLAVVMLLHDAVRPGPFGMSASLVLPVAAVLLRWRELFHRESRRQTAAIAFVLTPSLHILLAVAMGVAGRGLPEDTGGFFAEMLIGAMVSGLGAPWLYDFTVVLVRLFGAQPESERSEA